MSRRITCALFENSGQLPFRIRQISCDSASQPHRGDAVDSGIPNAEWGAVVVSAQSFQSALGIAPSWFVADVVFDKSGKTLNIKLDFQPGSRFRVADLDSGLAVQDTLNKRHRHLNFLQHACFLYTRVARVKLPDGSGQVPPNWAGWLSGYTLLFDALVLLLAQPMPFRGVARVTGLSVHRVMAIFERDVDLGLAQRDLFKVRPLAIVEASRARGLDFLVISADSKQRAVIFVTEGKDAATIWQLAEFLNDHDGDPAAINSCSKNMTKVLIKGVWDNLANAQITFIKFHVIALASRAVDLTRRAHQKRNTDLKSMRWKLLRDPGDLNLAARTEFSGVLAQLTSLWTASAWLYRERLRDILKRKQVHVVSRMLTQWCTDVMRSKVEPIKAVARMIRSYFEGITAWVQGRQTNGVLEALNGLFRAARQKFCGDKRLSNARTNFRLLVGKFDSGPSTRMPMLKPL